MMRVINNVLDSNKDGCTITVQGESATVLNKRSLNVSIKERSLVISNKTSKVYKELEHLLDEDAKSIIKKGYL